MEPPKVPDLQHLTLPTKPDNPIAYTFTTLHEAPAASPSPPIWLIFINGLGLPQAYWQPTLRILQSDLANSSVSPPPSTIYATTYDRYGQGLSRPVDGSPEPHETTDSVSDLAEILSIIHQNHLYRQRPQPQPQPQPLKRILIAHSIGVPLARLYLAHSQQKPQTAISASLFLDSNVANTDLVTLLPDPLSPSFSPSDLPSDTSLQDLQVARENYARLFSPSAPNSENLDRRTLPGLLPYANAPVIRSADENPLHLTVVAHDPETFAEESLKICTSGLTGRYIEPAWQAYNAGLMELGNNGSAAVGSRPVVARGSGHFVQRDNPRCVADEVRKLIGRVNESIKDPSGIRGQSRT